MAATSTYRDEQSADRALSSAGRPLSRVLLVDDDRGQLESVAALIRDEGFEVEMCATAHEALERAKSREFGIAVVDQRLPDLSGVELLKRLRSRSPAMRVIIHTGYGEFDSAKEAVNLGAFAYVEKLADPRELLNQIHRAARDRVLLYVEELEQIVEQRTASLRASEEQLRQSQKMEALGQLAGGVAHDMNNLLTAIFGYIEIAKTYFPASHPALESLEHVEQASRQASGVMRSLLTFSRKTAAEKKRVDMARVVRDCTKLLRRMVSASIDLSCDAPTDESIWVFADEMQMQQVILNLAINARDALPDGGRLEISVRAEPHGAKTGDVVCLLVVRDNGRGIAPAVAERVFEPFFTTKPAGKGTGLGLSIVHGIVSDHGGAIRIDSQPERGTTVTVRLPLAGEERGSQPESETDAPRGRNELILVAEDHPYVRQIMCSALRSLGYRVIEASDGEELLAQVQQRGDEVDLLVADLDLPRRSGFECIREVRTTRPRLPIIATTGATGLDISRAGLENTLLLRKPFKPHELAHRIHATLRAHEKRVGQNERDSQDRTGG
ncbi:MAG: response regulator [Planctomycetota bacterium]|nr:MAG: response regulator [Planctomycetota bacterium]